MDLDNSLGLPLGQVTQGGPRKQASTFECLEWGRTHWEYSTECELGSPHV